jgi:hypothetical protein
MSWVRLPLFFGTLKIKPRRHLRRDEISRKIRVMKLGSIYVTWRPHVSSEKRVGAGPRRIGGAR